ncbi:MAG: hypothetical protein DRI57_28745 [Deltaproteobacteria bacterium]|nr:MAG: hypothetical protein DRI57_28745 [Deltaproteobacteria bacterium]
MWLHKISDSCDPCKPQMNADERGCSRTLTGCTGRERLSAFICGSYRKPQKPLEPDILQKYCMYRFSPVCHSVCHNFVINSMSEK